MRRVIILFLILSFLCFGCASLHPVATLDELSSKEDLAKQRNWYKQDEARVRAGIFMGGTLILAPIAFVWASIPSYTGLTVSQISEFSAVKTYEYNAILNREWIAYTDGAMSIDYWVYGRSKGMKDDQNNKPVALIYKNKSTNKVYYEATVVNKDEKNSIYKMWKSPVLRKKGDDLVYVLDESLKLKKAKSSNGNFVHLFFEKDLTGEEIEKGDTEILTEFKARWQSLGHPMEELKYCDGDGEKKGLITDGKASAEIKQPVEKLTMQASPVAEKTTAGVPGSSAVKEDVAARRDEKAEVHAPLHEDVTVTDLLPRK